MLKIINYIKDAFLVYDDYKKSGARLSEAMVTNALMLVSSMLVGFGLISTGFTDEEVMAIGTGIYAAINLVIRLRSDGGKIKVRDDLGAKLRNADPSDEHTRL